MIRTTLAVGTLVVALFCGGCALLSPEYAAARASANAEMQVFVETSRQRTLFEAKRELKAVEDEVLSLTPRDSALEFRQTKEERNLFGCRGDEDLHSWPFTSNVTFDADTVDVIQLMNDIGDHFADLEGWSVSTGQPEGKTEVIYLKRSSDDMFIAVSARGESGTMRIAGFSGCFLLKNYHRSREF